jgi:hypothetical protein
MIDPLRAVGTPLPELTPPAPVTPTAAKPVTGPAKDRNALSGAKAGSASTPVALFGATPPEAKSDKPQKPWGIRSVNLHWGPELAYYGKSDMRLQQPGTQTDVTLHDVKAVQRTTFDAFYNWPNGYFQIDEPQSAFGISTQFNNGFGFELNAKHNKYVVYDRDQMVRMTGTIGGEAVDEMRPMSSLQPQYEVAHGMNQLGVMGTYAFELPAIGKKDRFNLITKAGPQALMNWTYSKTVNPQSGVTEEGPGQYRFGGMGAVVENELRYAVRDRVTVGLSHSVSFLANRGNAIAGGTINHNVWANQFNLSLGYNVFKRK